MRAALLGLSQHTATSFRASWGILAARISEPWPISGIFSNEGT